MNPQKAALLLVLTTFTSLAFAEDFKTIKGKEYKDAGIIRVESDGVVLQTKWGISKVYFTELPKVPALWGKTKESLSLFVRSQTVIATSATQWKYY